MYGLKRLSPCRRLRRLCAWLAAGGLLFGATALAASPGQEIRETPAVADESGTFGEPATTPGKAVWSFVPGAAPPWRELDPGLEIACFPGRDPAGNMLEMIILRIDPRRFTFSVHTATREGEALSLGAWADRYGLSAVINASMYLPDGRTSTGYLRVDDHLNNGRVAGRFGAFFVSDPAPAGQGRPALPAGRDGASGAEEGQAAVPDDALPEAAVLDRTCDAWQTLLPRYRNVVQNYRLISADRRLLWNPGGPRHAIAAVGRDGSGHILFIHCREPLTGVAFGELLLALPIDVRVVMYTEGGSQAGLLVRSGPVRKIWMGRHPADIWTQGQLSAPLPNVIGIRPKAGAPVQGDAPQPMENGNPPGNVRVRTAR